MNDSLDIAFIAGMFPPGSENEIIKNSKISVEFAANAFQMKLAKGFMKNGIKNFKILNSMFVNSYPRGYKQMVINSNPFTLSDGNFIHENIGFVNVYFFRHFFKYFTLKPYVKEWAKKDLMNTKILVGYTALNPTLELFKLAKSVNKDIKTCLIVPDLPNMCTRKKKLFNIFLNSVSKKMSKYQIYIDNYVVLTEQMATELNFSRNYVVIEGIIDSDEKNDSCNSSINIDNVNRTPIVLYSGTLNEKYGVVNLVEAFKRIEDKNYRLVICGKGDAEALIKLASSEDRRIEYRGLLNNSDVLSLQKAARVLVNPRQNNEEYTKFSFPSKNLEYMMSGRPLIAYKLDGIPDEYDNYLLYVQGNSIDDLKESILNTCNESDEVLNIIGRKARDFALLYKNEYIQVKKILQMFGDDYDDEIEK